MRFNRLFSLVLEDREKCKDFEIRYMQLKQEKHYAKRGKRPRYEEDVDTSGVPVIVCCDEIDQQEEI